MTGFPVYSLAHIQLILWIGVLYSTCDLDHQMAKAIHLEFVARIKQNRRARLFDNRRPLQLIAGAKAATQINRTFASFAFENYQAPAVLTPSSRPRGAGRGHLAIELAERRQSKVD